MRAFVLQVRKALHVEEYPAELLWDATRHVEGWDGTRDSGDEPGWYPFGHEVWGTDGYPDPTHLDPPAHPHWDAATRTVDLRPLMRELASQIRVLVYSGDVDAQVPAVGSERWVESVGLASAEGWRPWCAEGVVAGGVKVYQDPAATVRGRAAGLAFCTVRGAGHGAPQHRPASMLALLGAVLAGEELPRLPERGRL